MSSDAGQTQMLDTHFYVNVKANTNTDEDPQVGKTCWGITYADFTAVIEKHIIWGRSEPPSIIVYYST